jgi:hypothetical protein
LYPILKSTQTKLTGHSYAEIFTPKGWQAPAWPLLATCFLFVLIYFFEPLIGFVYVKLFPKYVLGEVKVDEEIDNYWAALDYD